MLNEYFLVKLVVFLYNFKLFTEESQTPKPLATARRPPFTFYPRPSPFSTSALSSPLLLREHTGAMSFLRVWPVPTQTPPYLIHTWLPTPELPTDAVVTPPTHTTVNTITHLEEAFADAYLAFANPDAASLCLTAAMASGASLEIAGVDLSLAVVAADELPLCAVHLYRGPPQQPASSTRPPVPQPNVLAALAARRRPAAAPDPPRLVAPPSLAVAPPRRRTPPPLPEPDDAAQAPATIPNLECLTLDTLLVMAAWLDVAEPPLPSVAAPIAPREAVCTLCSRRLASPGHLAMHVASSQLHAWHLAQARKRRLARAILTRLISPPPAQVHRRQLPAPIAEAPPPDHLRGIGASIMARLGWQPGSGLGRQNNGRVDVVTPVVRPPGLGLGASSRASSRSSHGGAVRAQVRTRLGLPQAKPQSVAFTTPAAYCQLNTSPDDAPDDAPGDDGQAPV